MKTRAKCVIITGRPACGKTTLARRLSQLLYMPMLSRDEMKEGYVTTFGMSHEELPEDTSQIATDLFLSTTRILLKAKVSVLVDAAFRTRSGRRRSPIGPTLPSCSSLSATLILPCVHGVIWTEDSRRRLASSITETGE